VSTTHLAPIVDYIVRQTVGPLLSGKTPDEAVKLGWAHGALMTTFPGDTTMATLDQVEQFAQGGSARIQR